jgi:single-stranded DNA-binding protein
MTMLGGKSSGAGSFEVVENKPAAASGGSGAAKAAPAKGSFDNFDDDIPF